MFVATAIAYGPYLHGAKKGQTNPKAAFTLETWGKDGKEAIEKIKNYTNGALFTIQNVVNLAK
jgi:hypothetical protein